jgi:galactokinase
MQPSSEAVAFLRDFVARAKLAGLPPMQQQHLAKCVGSGGLIESFAPGRINLLGEHVDYMGGKVLPAAVSAGCYVFATLTPAPSSDGGGTSKPTFLCSFDEKPFVFDASKISKEDGKSWRVFATAAMVMVADELGMSVAALTANIIKNRIFYIVGTLPIGSGMSSSAALSVALINSMRYIAATQAQRSSVNSSGAWQQPPKALVQLAVSARRIEVEFCGLNCGIMDQFASVHGAKGHFLELDCATLAFKRHPLLAALGDRYTLLLANSMVKHDLGDSYNKIRNDMESAQKKIGKALESPDFTFSAFVREPKTVLAAAAQRIGAVAGQTPAAFIAAVEPLLTPSEFRRASYVMQEMLRTEEFIAAVRDSSSPQSATAARIGQLLTATHRGLADQLGVSTEELELIHHTATRKCPGVLGGRVMGGGFGGCIIMLLEKTAVAATRKTIGDAFRAAFKMDCEFIDAVVGDGARVRQLGQLSAKL